MLVTMQFDGGVMNGTVSFDGSNDDSISSHDQSVSFAAGMLWTTNNGEVGKRAWAAWPYAIHQTYKAGSPLGNPKAHKYHVAERREEENGDLFVRLKCEE